MLEAFKKIGQTEVSQHLFSYFVWLPQTSRLAEKSDTPGPPGAPDLTSPALPGAARDGAAQVEVRSGLTGDDPGVSLELEVSLALGQVWLGRPTFSVSPHDLPRLAGLGHTGARHQHQGGLATTTSTTGTWQEVSAAG